MVSLFVNTCMKIKILFSLVFVAILFFCKKNRDVVEIIYDGNLLVAGDKGVIRIKR
jgi:hypothetical protein